MVGILLPFVNDIGLAFSNKRGYIFKNGKMIEELNLEKASKRLIELIQKLVKS